MHDIDGDWYQHQYPATDENDDEQLRYARRVCSHRFSPQNSLQSLQRQHRP